MLQRCATCDLVFAPAYADPDEVYVDGYLLGDGEFGSNFGFDVMHPEFQEFLAHVARRRLEVIERVTRPPGRFLDVGCGTGEVLAAARDRGWTACGAEPVADSARRAVERGGLDVRAATLEDSGFPERSFDVVGAFHVLEHMTDGVGFLRSIARWAAPGGHVVVEVPNWHSFHRRGFGHEWPALRPLEHVAHYSPAILAATLRRAGLEPVRIRTPGFLSKQQSLDQALRDLGAQALQPWVMRSRFLARSEEHGGVQVSKPSAVGWPLLRVIESVYAATRTGMVIVAIARVP
jgi:SAM-dependent methyltransferase